MLVPENVHWDVVLPQAILGVAMLIVLLQEMAGSPRRAEHAGVTALLGTGLALGAVLFLPSSPSPAFNGTIVQDGLFRVFAAAILISQFLALLLAGDYARRQGYSHRCEFYALFLSAGLGMLLMAAALNLALVFLGLELFSLALYLLCIYPAHRSTSQEAAMKYFLLSSFASAVLLFGCALLYGGSGALSLEGLKHALSGGEANRPLLMGGLVLVALGLCFKLAAAPFHLWAPDVYQGAPTPVTAFMSVATKAAALAVLVRLFPLTFSMPPWPGDWQGLLAALSLLTMLVGNLGALAQTNVKRMLAYSSVAHAGYLLMAPVVMGSSAPANLRGLEALLFYLLVYAFMNVGAFAVVAWLEDTEGCGIEVKALSGLASRRPATALGIAVVMLSLTGLPPAGGFFAKLFLFGAAVASKWTFLAVIGVLGSLMGAYYYLRVVVAMYMREGDGTVLPSMGMGTAVAFWLAVAGLLLTGVLAQIPLDWVQDVARRTLTGG